MDKKGQLGFIKVLAFAILFVIFFSLALAPFVASSLDIANVSALGYLGSFVLKGLNIWFFIAFLLVVILALIYGVGSSE